jgi:putative membrane protein
MGKLVMRWVVIVLALLAAAWLVPGFHVGGDAWVAYAVMAAVLGVVNTLVKPVLKMLTCPLIVLTLGLFTLVINAAMLLLAAKIAGSLGVHFSIDGWWPALWGGLIVSVVTTVLSVFVKDKD